LDISGKEVLTGTHLPENSSISLAQLPAGIYIFHGITPQGAIIQKIVKE